MRESDRIHTYCVLGVKKRRRRVRDKHVSSRGALASAHWPLMQSAPPPHFLAAATDDMIHTRLAMYPRMQSTVGSVCLRCQWRLINKSGHFAQPNIRRGIYTIKVGQTPRRALHATTTVCSHAFTSIKIINHILTRNSAHNYLPYPKPLRKILTLPFYLVPKILPFETIS